jgi:hypothetical protein
MPSLMSKLRDLHAVVVDHDAAVGHDAIDVEDDQLDVFCLVHNLVLEFRWSFPRRRESRSRLDSGFHCVAPE